MTEVTSVKTLWGPWNGRQLKLLKDGYEKAVAEGRTEFTVVGQKVLTAFARYLIEYLEGQGLRPCD